MESEKSKTATTENDTIAIPIRIGKRMAFLDLLLWNAKKDSSIDFDGIQEEVDTFMFEVNICHHLPRLLDTELTWVIHNDP